MNTDQKRRLFLQTAAMVATGGALSAASSRAFAAEGAAPAIPTFGKLPPWKIIYHLEYRIPEGKLEEFSNHWGGTQVPALEKRTGQMLWGGWRAVSGLQNKLTHHWAYRDLAHYESAEILRRTDPEAKAAFGRQTVPIQEQIVSTMIVPLSYHPAVSYPDLPQNKPGVIATHRINTRASAAAGPKDQDHQAAAAAFAQAAAKHGAQLVGAFRTYEWSVPAFHLQVWRYASMDQYWAAREKIYADPQCRDLLATMHEIYPDETVELHLPLSYSRLR